MQGCFPYILKSCPLSFPQKGPPSPQERSIFFLRAARGRRTRFSPKPPVPRASEQKPDEGQAASAFPREASFSATPPRPPASEKGRSTTEKHGRCPVHGTENAAVRMRRSAVLSRKKCPEGTCLDGPPAGSSTPPHRRKSLPLMPETHASSRIFPDTARYS